jgi:hypothetical protein
MKPSNSISSHFVASVDDPPSSWMKAYNSPTSPVSRRELPFSSLARDTASRGRWDSARVAALEFLVAVLPDRSRAIPTATQLELHFA